ncbi:putative lipid II flippase FtsW [Candidatus Daviesbacteria bacterium]|nr:putative lipid II flippase FtsW [Candidatus Daviesbacteria bacterium]
MQKTPHLQSQKKLLDLPLLLAVCFLTIFGLIILYDASSIQAIRDFKDPFYYIRQQIIWALIGFLSLTFFSFFDYHKFKALALPLLITSLLLLLAVFIPGFGVSGGGAHRWLNVGPITLQPSEIIKISGVIFLATYFEKKVRLLLFSLLIIFVTLITAVLQRDLGSTLVFITTSSAIYFVAGGAIWHFLIAMPVALAGLIALIFTSGYRSRRILAFLDPTSDPQGFSYHINQVLIALGSGGLLGLGLTHSRQKFEYIPEVSTDSIFGIIGEELGFLGSSVIILIFAFLISRGFKIAASSSDNFGRILALGLTFWLGIQTVINLSSMVALLPLTGVPLPFISYGGSAVVANLTAVGILLNISRQSNRN